MASLSCNAIKLWPSNLKVEYKLPRLDRQVEFLTNTHLSGQRPSPMRKSRPVYERRILIRPKQANVEHWVCPAACKGGLTHRNGLFCYDCEWPNEAWTQLCREYSTLRLYVGFSA